MQYITPSFRLTAAVAVVAILAGCASPIHRAPVEERASTTQAQRLPPGAENAGKPGYYTIKPSDTLIRIGLETGQSWRDIAAWNNIENPNRIEVGQVIRIVPPVGEAAATSAASAGGMASAKPVTTARIEARPVDGKAASTPAASAASVAASGSPPPPTPVPPARIGPRPVDGKAASTPAASAASVAASGSSSATAASAPETKPDVKSGDEPPWIWPAKRP